MRPSAGARNRWGRQCGWQVGRATRAGPYEPRKDALCPKHSREPEGSTQPRHLFIFALLEPQRVEGWRGPPGEARGPADGGQGAAAATSGETARPQRIQNVRGSLEDSSFGTNEIVLGFSRGLTLRHE